jgi:hypothetical protein
MNDNRMEPPFASPSIGRSLRCAMVKNAILVFLLTAHDALDGMIEMAGSTRLKPHLPMARMVPNA